MGIFMQWQTDEPNIVARLRRIAERIRIEARPFLGFRFQRTVRVVEGFDPPHVDPVWDVVITVGRRWLWKHLTPQQLAGLVGHILQDEDKWIRVDT